MRFVDITLGDIGEWWRACTWLNKIALFCLGWIIAWLWVPVAMHYGSYDVPSVLTSLIVFAELSHIRMYKHMSHEERKEWGYKQ